MSNFSSENYGIPFLRNTCTANIMHSFSAIISDILRTHKYNREGRAKEIKTVHFFLRNC